VAGAEDVAGVRDADPVGAGGDAMAVRLAADCVSCCVHPVTSSPATANATTAQQDR
jgi:hypothetical protein